MHPIIRAFLWAWAASVLLSFWWTALDVWSEKAPARESHENMRSFCLVAERYVLTPLQCDASFRVLARSFYLEILALSLQKTPWCFGHACSELVNEAAWTTRIMAVCGALFAAGGGWGRMGRRVVRYVNEDRPRQRFNRMIESAP